MTMLSHLKQSCKANWIWKMLRPNSKANCASPRLVSAEWCSRLSTLPAGDRDLGVRGVM